MSSSGGGISVTIGRVSAAAVAAAAIAAGVLVPPAITGGSGVSCDSTVTTRTALASALGTTGSSGDTICVTANITGSRIVVTADMSSQARFIAQPANMTIDLVPIEFQGAHKITIEGFELTSDGFATSSSSSGDIRLLKNYIHGFTGNGVEFQGGVSSQSGMQVIGNRIECMNYNPSSGSPTGYGIYSDAPTTGAVINYNTVRGCGNTADGMQIADFHDGDISFNVIDEIGYNGTGTNPHPDTIMVWAGSDDVTITNNRFVNSTGTLMSPDGDDITYVNNLIVHHQTAFGSNQCVDSTANGSSGNVSPLRHTWRQNTVWDCGNGGINMNQATGARGSNVADRNLAESVSCSSATVWSDQNNHNLIGGSKTCWPGATNTASFSPSWANTSDPDDPDYFIPTNLLTGYEDVGYSYVPAGYEACEC